MELKGIDDKSLVSVLKAAPELLKMEQLWKLSGITKHWGMGNVISMILKTVGKMGLVNTTRALLTFKLDKFIMNFFVSMWEVFGDREAIIDGDERFTFKEYKDRTFRLANALKGFGVEPRDGVAELLYNSHEWAELYFGTSFLGCRMPLINTHLNDKETIEVINNGDSRVLIFDEEFTDQILRIKDQLEMVEHYVVVGERAPEGMILYEDMLARSSTDMPESDVFLLGFNPYSGGTTGTPKNISTFDTLSYAFSSVAEAPRVPFAEYLKLLVMEFGAFGYWGAGTLIDAGKWVSATPTPCYHMGIMASYVPWLIGCGPVVTLRKYNAEEYLRLVEKEKISWSFVVPSTLNKIMALPDDVKHRYDLSSMRSLICSAAPCPVETSTGINKLFKEQGAPVDVFVSFYANSESQTPCLLLREDYQEDPKRLESEGKSGRAGYVNVLDEETGTWCPPGKVGVVHVRTANTVGLRYAHAPEKTKAALRIVDGEEWMDDGLYGYLDEDDFLYITGRKKEVLNIGGALVYPNEIEKAILKHPKVFDVAVIRYPDKELSEVAMALVQLHEGEKMSEEEVIKQCKKEGLYGFKIPKKVEFRTLPRDDMSKVLKRFIEEEFWGKAEEKKAEAERV